jgi:Putative transposase
VELTELVARRWYEQCQCGDGRFKPLRDLLCRRLAQRSRSLGSGLCSAFRGGGYVSFVPEAGVLFQLCWCRRLGRMEMGGERKTLRLADKKTFKRFIAPLRRIKWVVYCKAPFAGPEQVLRYLSRYTHRVAISNRRIVAADDDAIAFRWKDYRINGPGRWKTMRLHPHEFIRRFLIHVLPKGFHRIRHYGLFANANRAENIATARALLNVAPPAADPQQPPDIATDTPRVLPCPCPCPRCGGRMIVIETFAPGCQPSWRPMPTRIDTS